MEENSKYRISCSNHRCGFQYDSNEPNMEINKFCPQCRAKTTATKTN